MNNDIHQCKDGELHTIVDKCVSEVRSGIWVVQWQFMLLICVHITLVGWPHIWLEDDEGLPAKQGLQSV